MKRPPTPPPETFQALPEVLLSSVIPFWKPLMTPDLIVKRKRRKKRKERKKKEKEGKIGKEREKERQIK